MAVDRRSVRLGILASVAFILVGLLGVRLWFLQTVRADELQARVDRSKTRVIQLHPSVGGSLMQTAEFLPITSAF